MKKGFTLLELLIVIIILGTLAAIAMPRYFANLENARRGEAMATTNRIREVEIANFSAAGVYDATFPINVVLGGATIDLSQPISDNFTYAIVLGALPVNSGCTATFIAGAGTTSYYRCFDNGKFAVGALVCP
jgi:prepilin-type N-terminal cleavage/methylation domain-containing protein